MKSSQDFLQKKQKEKHHQDFLQKKQLQKQKAITEGVCSRIDEKFKEYNKNHKIYPHLKISLGFAVKDVEDDLEHIFRKADRRMYREKDSVC